jgi:hypothetical protein
MTEKGVRNDKKSVQNTTALVMLNEVKHPCTGFLTALRMTEKTLGMTQKMHLE